MSKITTLLAASCLAFAGAAANAATVTNGSFEDFSGNLNDSGWNFFSSAQVTGWDGTPNIEIQTQPTLDLTPQDGSAYAELDTTQNSTLSQSIDFGAAGTYELSFYYSPRVPAQNNPSNSTNDMDFSIVGDEGATDGLIAMNGSVTGAPNDVYQVGQWTEVTAMFSIQTAGSYLLSFFGAGAENEQNNCGDCGALIDNVSISAVPLPASSLLLLAGLGGLGAMRRMKRS